MVSTPLRSAPPCLRQPFHTRAQIIFRANRALVFSASFCLRRLEPTFAFDGCSLRFYLFQYPAQIRTPRKPRTCCFAFFCLRRLQPTLAFAGCSLRFYLFHTRRRFIHRANRAPAVFAFFCLRRLQPTLAFAGCSLRSYLFQYSAQSIQK